MLGLAILWAKRPLAAPCAAALPVMQCHVAPMAMAHVPSASNLSYSRSLLK